jgi:integrase
MRYDAAKAAAEEWFRHLDHGGSTDRVTVKSACEAYVAHLRRERTEAAATDAEGSFHRLVDDDPIARIELEKLRPAHMTAWRERIFDRGARTYFNRNLTALRAALNLALDDRKVATDAAWAKALKPLQLDPGEGRRTIYLTQADRRKLIEKASKEFKPLLTAWTLLPVRPGDIAKLRVDHLDVKHRILRIPGGKVSAREVPLPDGALAHFKECARSKLPSAWLIAKADGNPWDRFAWRDSMWEAVGKAKLPRATVAYTIRHSVITDLVVGGLDIFTVAKLSGTSVAMVDRFYGKLRAKHARAALAKLAL